MTALTEKLIVVEDQMAGKAAAAEAENVRELVDLLSKLNPSAKEFFPSSYSNNNNNGKKLNANAPSTAAAAGRNQSTGRLSADAPIFISALDYYTSYQSSNSNWSSKDSSSDGSVNNNSSSHQPYGRKRNGYNNKQRGMNERARKGYREGCIRRTVYVSDIDQQVTEEQLASVFSICGKVRDCRICGDPHSVLRFAFIEFEDEYGAKAALSLGGTILGYYPLKVLPSKTAILPVNPSFLPQSEDEKEMVARTVYCTNIDRKVTQADVKLFFDSLCGEVSRLRLLGDNIHSTRIAFVEFVQADSAIIALGCSGMILGSLPVRVSPSKTPVRPRALRGASR